MKLPIRSQIDKGYILDSSDKIIATVFNTTDLNNIVSAMNDYEIMRKLLKESQKRLSFSDKEDRELAAEIKELLK